MRLDLVIRNGLLIDGRRTPSYRADVGIRDGKVALIGRLASGSGDRELDAEGLIVAPGVVDGVVKTTGSASLQMISGLFSLGILIWMIVWFVKRGEAANQWGENPLGAGAAAAGAAVPLPE